MIPIVYRWDDGNAPVARGERRSLCDILHACLVTGYGDKPAAGWTREFVNATFDRAAFRPGAGTRFYLQVDGLGATNAYASNIRAFETMSNVDTGVFPFKSSWVTQDVCGTSSAAGTTARPWVVIADDRFFYFFCWPSATGTAVPADNNQTVAVMCFGDIVSRYASDPYGCVLGCYQVQASSGSYVFGPISDPSGTVGNIAMPRAITGVATPLAASLIRGGGPGGRNHMGADGVPYSAGGQLLVSRPHVNEATAYSMRGFLPGLYYPCHPLAFSNLQQFSAAGKTFLSVRNVYYQQNNNIFISLDDWWA